MFSPQLLVAACNARVGVLFGCSCRTNVEALASTSGNQSLKTVIHLNLHRDTSFAGEDARRVNKPLRPRQRHHGFEAAHRQISQDEGATVGLDNITRDTQSQSTATRIAVPRGLEPVERLEHAFQLILRDSRPIIAHTNHQG